MTTNRHIEQANPLAAPEAPLCRNLHFLQLFNRSRSTHHLDECWEWAGTRAKGYGVIVIRGVQYRASRIVLNEANPEVQILHTCDNPPCVNPAHLQRGSIRENQWDKGRKGRAARGEENGGGGKLTAAGVASIRERLGDPRLSLVDIGREFGVSPTMVAHIRDRRAWRYLL